MVPVDIPMKEIDQLDKMVNDMVKVIEQLKDKPSRLAAATTAITTLLLRVRMSNAERIGMLEVAKYDIFGVKRKNE